MTDLATTSDLDKARTPWAGFEVVPPELPNAPTDDEKWLYFGRQHRWFIWLRTFATVAAVTSLLLFSFSTVILWWFWVPFSIFCGYMVLTHYCTSRPRRISLVDHQAITELWAPTRYPSVDVFLPSAGEDLAVLNNTYRHVAAMHYEGDVEVLVLDDADRPEVAALAASYGFTYHVRPDRGVMKKAGNLKYGLEHSGGDLIVIFDADFCPRADFIVELAPYFDEFADVGIVQSPQFFDSHKQMAWLQRCAGTVQESFYRWAQVSRDQLGAPICVGTCAVYRRAGLDASGGFAQIGHSEDVHTGVNLMKAGYRTMYVPVVLAKGLCPDKMSSFISQQYRWCAGSMSLLRDRSFHDSPLTYRQRMCFFSGFGYYISTAVGIFTLPLPTIIMVWFLPDRVRLENFFWLIPTFMLYPLVRAMHKTGWGPATIRVYTISSYAHAAAIFHVLTGRTAEWVPTGETRRTSMTTNVTALMIMWMGVTNVIMLVGVLTFIATRHDIVNIAPVLVVVSLNWFVWTPIALLAWRERQARVRQKQVALRLATV
ncbi:MAG: cellulose synthase [Frankiales bacterium]|nr:cellulose synthase [Frankiales bacterium]